MNEPYSRRKPIKVLVSITIVAAVVLAVFVYGVLVGKNKQFPYPLFATAFSTIQRLATVARMGEAEYVKTQIKAQSTSTASATGGSAGGTRGLETSVLPLKLTAIPLGKGGDFPSGGGNIANVEGRIVILDRLGGLYSYSEAGLKKLDFGEFPNNLAGFIVHSQGKLSLDTLRTHSLAYDKTGKKLYVSFEKYASNGRMIFTIASIGIDPKSLGRVGNWQTVYEAQPLDETTLGIAGGGKLLVDGDRLYFAVGDFSLYATDGRSEHAAQDVKSPFGKIYEYGLRTGVVKVKSIGHRNTQGLAISREGLLLNVEHGPQGGDEINIIEDGKNYGWPVATYGTDYGAYDWSWKTAYDRAQASKGGGSNAVLTEPLMAFVPSIGISSIYLVSGFNERWDGDLLVGSLKAQTLYRIKVLERRIVFSEPIWIGSRIRDINAFQGKLVLLTDDSHLIFLEVDREKLAGNSKFAGYNFEPKLNACLQCHHFGQTTPANAAPSLTGVLNRKIASDAFSRYSPALSKIQGNWDRSNLKKFIANPSAFAPGSSMPRLGLSDEDIDEIVDILAH